MQQSALPGIALVGLGMAVAPHARSLLDLADRVRVVWAASPTQSRIEDFGASYPFPVTTDVAGAITDPAVDAVILLTPPGSHCDLALAALSAGKHVLVEKPLELTAARGREIVAAAEAAGRLLGAVLQHRFRPGAARLKQLVDAGSLSIVEHISLSVPWWRPQAYYDEPGRGTLARDGGGVLLTQAIHSIDLLRWIGGPMQVHSAIARTTDLHRMEAEDIATAILRLQSGGTATITATTAHYPGFPETLDIIGTVGTARLQGEALGVSWLDGRTELLSAEGSAGHGADAMGFSHHAHRALIANFLAAMEGRETLVCSGRDALDTQLVIEDILLKAAP